MAPVLLDLSVPHHLALDWIALPFYRVEPAIRNDIVYGNFSIPLFARLLHQLVANLDVAELQWAGRVAKLLYLRNINPPPSSIVGDPCHATILRLLTLLLFRAFCPFCTSGGV